MRKILLVALISFLALIALPTATTLAASPIKGDYCTGDAANSAFCKDSGNTTNTISGNNGVIQKVIDVMAVIAGIVAVVMIMFSGYKFMTANGDANAVATARRNLIYALVGIVIIVLAEAIVRFVIGQT